MTVTVTTDYRQWFEVYTEIFKLTTVLTTELQAPIRSLYWNFSNDRGINYRLQVEFETYIQKFDLTVTVTTDYRQWFEVHTGIFELTVVLTTDYRHRFEVYIENFKMTVTVTTDYRQWFEVYTEIFKLTVVLTTELQAPFRSTYRKFQDDRYRNYRLQAVIWSVYWNWL